MKSQVIPKNSQSYFVYIYMCDKIRAEVNRNLYDQTLQLFGCGESPLHVEPRIQ